MSIAGVASFGTFPSSPQGRLNKMFQVVDNLSHQAGCARAARGRGFPVQRRHDHVPARRARQYTFSSMANFLTGVYNNAGFGQTFGELVIAQTNANIGIYAQDEWKAASTPDAESRRAL